MALLNGTTLHPPDGWRYLQPETHLWIKADMHDELVDLVVAHREHKGLTPTDRKTVSLEIQRQICLGAPKGTCKGEPGENYAPFIDQSRSLSLTKLALFSETLVRWLKDGLHMVSPVESKARAEICRGCPFNKTPAACSCTPFWKLIDALVPKERHEDGLFVCALCGCALKAKILAPLDVAREGNPVGLRLPSWCWQTA